MIKISVYELEQALSLIKKTSTDMHVIVRDDSHALAIQFQTIDGQISTINIYDESVRLFAKVSATENLSQVLHRKGKA